MRTRHTLAIALLLAAPTFAQSQKPLRIDRETRIGELRDEIASKRAELARLQAELARLLKEEGAAHIGSREAERRMAEARAAARSWIADVMQVTDASKRETALRRIREALASDAPIENRAALVALGAIGEVRYDKTPFRTLVLPFTGADFDDETRIAALQALYSTARKAGDLDLVLALADRASPLVRRSLAHLLFLFGEGRLEGRSADVLLSLLRSEDPGELREVLRGIWGASVSPAIAARLVELAESPAEELRHDAIYFALSTLQDKTRPVVEALMAAVRGADPNDSQRALWGLGFGVPEELRARVADFFLEIFRSRDSERLRVECLRLVARYGDASHLPDLRAIAADEALPTSLRAQAEEATHRLQLRIGG